MADNDNKNIVEPEILNEEPEVRGIEKSTVERVMEDSFLKYSMSVIIDRALPDVRDGLKPVNRRILYAMNKNGWRAPHATVKSAKIVGEVMGNYHPHGDSSIYDAMVNLAQPWKMRYTLVEGQGNFGSMDGDEPAASRYTEARMDKIGGELLSDIDKETVDFRDNFDGTEKEPVVLPSAVPNILLNGQMGIAVGMATNIPPHNLGEVVDATVAQIDNPEITLDELLTHIKGPDFPTGAEVYGGAPMRQAYETGRGSVTIRAVASIEERKNGRYSIIITEVPYGMSKEGFVDKVRELVLAKKITHIADARDESARGKVRVVVELKKDAYPKKILNQLYKLTGLQTSFHYNVLALVNGIQPKVMGLKEILAEFIKHRQGVIRRRTEFELRKAKERAHILEGLKIALDHIDEVIKTIRESYDDADKRLMERFGLSEIQAAAILAMQLRRLQGLERDKIEEELKQLHELIKKLEAILADENEILRVVKEELLAMKEKYGDERRSKIINHELGKFSDEELIPEEESVILLTSENYIKRTLVSDYRRQNRGGKGKRGMTTKEEDVIDQVVQASSHDYLLFFTNMGRIFRLKAYEVPAASLSAKGVAAVNLLQLQPEEKITAIIKHEKNANEDGYLFMATKKGTVKKTPVKDYANVRTNGLIAIKLDEGDELRWIKRTTGENDVIVSTSAGQAIRFNEKDTRPMGRSARGVRGVRLRPNDSVVGMDIVTGDDQTLLVVSEKGFGKRTKVSNFPSHKRGGVGIKAAVVTAKTGPIISVQTIDPEITEALLVSQNGQTIRLGLSDIKLLGRTTQGVTIMRLSDGDAVSSIGLMADRPQDEGN
ncbi:MULTISPECIES: DNA gyrase subunit A [unclassified Candidatus Nanosynbacter]|uniref:DNA gyrase subunit A n=1 Tax=unclassified Candidatus Nanosynbacter TaxID=2725944 RepID=UPI001FB5F5A2|nr:MULTISPECIES: DNA gyrase subunit A [unclassified Candidatus Nanosynbacter]MCJ1963052.1 DNA gyrase subunit A [Candidatus Nanosynbacter sp. TM7-033]UOG68249.1 DNA gyrase subunit A [Candidatus Nanosynbacter sp. HMT-352]